MEYKNKIREFKSIFNQKLGRKQQILNDIGNIKKDLKYYINESNLIEEASLIIRTVAQKTQEKLEFCVSELVTLALSSVFGENAYKFKVKFEQKRGKTEVEFLFIDKNGEVINPIDDSGGGVLDIASFALRLSLYVIMPNKTDNVFILDEPFKHLRGKFYQEKTSEMIKMISRKLDLQIIMIGDVNFSIEADKVFEVKKINGYSIIEEK